MNIFEELKSFCKYEYVTRQDIYKITGGAISPATIAKLDSLGVGIQGAYVGRKKIYHIDNVITWLNEYADLSKIEE